MKKIDNLLSPNSIAIVGISEGRSMGGIVLGNLVHFSYSGDIHLVSQKSEFIGDRSCHKDISDLPENIDLAVLTIPANAVLEALKKCVKKKIKSVIIFASGFAENGDEGKQLQEEVRKIAEENGVMVAGPNTMGFTNYIDSIPVTFENLTANSVSSFESGIAVVSQSGAMANNMRDSYISRGLHVTYSVGTGNEAHVSMEDYVEALIECDRTNIISIYCEQVRYPERFIEICDRALQKGKPIVALLPGKSVRARAAAMSHTGAVISDHTSAVTHLSQSGVVVVESLDELLDTAALFNCYPYPIKGGLGFITNSGAVKNLALDFAEEHYINIPEFSQETVENLQQVLPGYAVAENPIDFTTANAKDPSIPSKIINILDNDDDIGLMLVCTMPGSKTSQKDKEINILNPLAKAKKAKILVILGDSLPLESGFEYEIKKSGVPFFRSTDRAMRAIAKLFEYGNNFAKNEHHKNEKLDNVDKLILVDKGVIPEYQSKEVLKKIGIQIPEGELARSLEDALIIVERIGYPVVIKAQSAQLSHKSEAGAVIVGIKNKDELIDQWKIIHENVKNYDSSIVLDGILVEEMSTEKGHEFLIGGKRDEWGVTVMIGMGGIWVEILKDFKLFTSKCSRGFIKENLYKLKISKIIDGYRGQKGVDVEQLVDYVLEVLNLMEKNKGIKEVDINPLLCTPKRSIALDALIVME